MRTRRAALLCAAWLVAGGAAARAQGQPAKIDLIDYKVTRGETCAAIATRLYGDEKWVSLIHDHNEMGPPPHSLKAGQVLRIPPSLPKDLALASPDARLTFLRRLVDAYTPDRHAGQKDEPLLRGHRVNTLAASSAEVTFADTSRLQLGEQTLVIILGSSSGETRSRGGAEDTTLMNGSLRAHLDELVGKKQPTALRTAGGATVRLDGGEAHVQVDARKTTRLAQHRGRSRLKAAGKEVAVEEGFGSKAEEGKAPTKPRPLPAPPVWIEPPPRQIVATDAPVTIAGRWGAGPAMRDAPAPALYRVQLARDDRWNDIERDVKVDASVTRLSLEGVPPGSYFLRVSAIDNDQFEGKPGETVRVEVAPPAPVAAAQQPAPPAPPPPPPPPSPPPPKKIEEGPRKVAPEVALAGSGNLGFSTGRPVAMGLGGMFELGLRVAFDKVALAVALRASVENYYYWIWEHSVYVAVPVTLRLRPEGSLVVPYIGAYPSLIAQHEKTGSGSIMRFGVGAFAGVQVRVGRGAFFFDVGYDHGVVRQDPPPETDVYGLHGLLGYRISPLF